MASGVTVAASAPPEKSIAVLPFADMSEKHDQEYFSDGLSEELINLLTKVPELRVPARTSSFYFKGKPTTIAEIAKMLGVAHVLEGSVRKDGDTVRVTVQLIRAADGYHLWSETYDRRVGELFKTQDDIASAVVRILRLHLLSSAIPASGAGEHVDAHNLLLQARFFSRRRDEGDEERSDDCIRRAVALDPNYALAWAYLSPRYGGDPRARQAAERALQLDPALPDARLAMGLWYERREWNWAAADKEFKRALELAPNYAVALQASSILAMKLGRFEEAIALAQRGTERDPISPDAFEQLGHALRHAEQWSEAEAAFRRALEISPRNPYARAYLGFVLSNQGHSQAALNEMRQVSDEAVRLWGLSIIYSAIGRRADSDRALAELTQKYADHEAGMISSAHAYRNERDAAFDWLDRAYAQRDGALSWLKVSQFWRKNLAGDPRYEQWLRKLNLAS